MPDDKTAEEATADLKAAARQLADEAFARGFEKAQSLAPFADRPNSAVMQDEGLLDYESEASAKTLELRARGVTGYLGNHAEIVAIKERYGRA